MLTFQLDSHPLQTSSLLKGRALIFFSIILQLRPIKVVDSLVYFSSTSVKMHHLSQDQRTWICLEVARVVKNGLVSLLHLKEPYCIIIISTKSMAPATTDTRVIAVETKLLAPWKTSRESEGRYREMTMSLLAAMV